MNPTVSKFHGETQNANQNSPKEKKTVKVSAADQLSPVALTTRNANRLPLPPLQWSHYDSLPTTIYVKNTGFTVMIQASFPGEVPHLLSGPLTEKYNFSQIHFHWGEHDETGSGHSVDGIRYPLEMHVVHVKKDCASLNKASGTKDGIAIAVHLFSLTEERNTSLDQLTAVLQFIKKPNCCAKLYPSSLSEIVHPFSNNYFLYWGAVPGSHQQNYRIIWLVSRQLLPVSSQQLQEFRELLNGKGHFIWSNSNDPHPLGDRSLFLVSPSENTDDTLFDISRQPTSSVNTLESDKSIEISNAEFKSLVALGVAEAGSCEICPHPNHAGYNTALSNHPVKIKEGDTSVEESCVDLGTLKEPGILLKPELNTTKDDHKEQTTNVNITHCGTACSAKYIPSQDMYSVISANEKEVHLKRKPLIVRKSDPSTEQACVFLTKPPSVHSAQSAPSLTTWGHLGLKTEVTDVSDPQKNISSEIIVSKTSVESLGAKKHREKNAKLGSLDASNNVKVAATQRSTDNLQQNVQTFDGKEKLNIMTSQEKYINSAVSGQGPDKEGMTSELKSKENKFCNGELFDDGLKTEYLLVKQAEPKKSFYKVIGEFLMTPDSKRTLVKSGHNRYETLFSEINSKCKHQPMNEEFSKSNKNVVYKKILLSFPSSSDEISKIQVLENSNNNQSVNINRDISKDRSASKVKFEVQKSITDHNNISGSNEEVSRNYYVTKITPVIKSQEENYVGSTEKKLYYAKPVLMKKDVTTEKSCQTTRNTSNTKDETNYSDQEYVDFFQKPLAETQFTEDDVKENKKNLTPAKSIQVGNDFIDIKNTNPLENNKPSDHLLMRKKVIASYKNTNTSGSTGSSENETSSQTVKDPIGPEISVKILQTQKSQTVYEIKENKCNQNYVYDIEHSSNENKAQSNINKNQTSNSSNKKKIKLAISFKSHGESSKSNEFQRQENLSLDKNESTVHKSNPIFQFSDDVVLEEELERTIYSSQKSKKKMTIKVTTPTYKLPSQSPPVVPDQPSSQHLVTIKKVEVPDPYYLSRVPRQPLVEYESFPTGHNERIETIQTEETTSEVKTTKTYTSIKKGNTKSENTKEEHFNKTETTDSFIRRAASINNQLNKQPNTKLNINKSTNTVKIEDKNENLQKITIDLFKPRNLLLDESLHSQHDGKINEVKSTRIVIGSHQPKKVFSANDNKLINEHITVKSGEGNIKSNTLEILIQQNQSQKYLSDNQDQFNNFQNNKTPQVHSHERDDNLIDESVKVQQVNNKSTGTESLENSTLNKLNKSKIKFIDVATSHTSQVLSFTEADEEPTKDPGFNTFSQEDSPHSQSEPEIIFVMDQSTDREKSLPPTKEIETEQETKSEKLIKLSKTQSKISKAVSENMHQPPKSEELVFSHDYDSSENESDSSHCHVTFKSETKMKLPTGQSAFMKSLAEVKLKSSKKSANSNIPSPRAISPAKVTTNQATMTTKDKCCSAIDLREEIIDPNYEISADTSTSVVDIVNYSPVNIKTDQAEIKILPPLKFIDHWNRQTSEDALLENNGKTVRATFLEDTNLPKLKGGPLESDYVFAELHFHWGRKDCCGAEHIIDDKRHSMEAHFLYFKEEYRSVKEALNHEDGLAMVAIQLNVGGQPHSLFGQLIKDIALIKEAETGVYVPAESLFSWIKQTVEEAAGYFSYKGTMTSEPPYVEAVTWLIFQQPIVFCCQQSLEFRKLMSPTGELLLRTHRAPRPLNNRTIIYVPS